MCTIPLIPTELRTIPHNSIALCILPTELRTIPMHSAFNSATLQKVSEYRARRRVLAYLDIEIQKLKENKTVYSRNHYLSLFIARMERALPVTLTLGLLPNEMRTIPMHSAYNSATHCKKFRQTLCLDLTLMC